MPHNDNPINPHAWYFRLGDKLVPAAFVAVLLIIAATHFVFC